MLRETELKEQAELTEDAKSRFRRTLGQLAWMRAFLQSGLLKMSDGLPSLEKSPNPPAESCLRAVLRWMKSRMTVVQEFPAGESSPEVLQAGCHKVLAYVDSSWSDPSVSGCLVMWFGCLIRSFSRAQSIAQMVGLLRRVRHLQLRASFLQYCVQHGLAVVFWIAGVVHGADGLTKTPTKDMLVNLFQTAGFVLVEALQLSDTAYEGPAAVECTDRSVYCEVAQAQRIPDSLEHCSSQLPLVGKKVSFSPDRNTVKEFVAT